MAVTRYYVDPIAGSNGNTGLSAGSPWLDLTNFGSTSWPGGAVQINILQGLVTLPSRLDLALASFYSGTGILEIIGTPALGAAGFQKSDQLLSAWSKHLRLVNVRMKLTGSAAMLAQFQTDQLIHGVYFENTGGGASLVSGGVATNRFNDCVFHTCSVSTFALLDGCLIVNGQAGSGDLNNCRLIRTTGSTALWNPSANLKATRCAFIRLGSAANDAMSASGFNRKIVCEGCVFANFAMCMRMFTNGNEAIISHRNALFNCTTFTDTTNSIINDSNVTLVSTPYTDPANNDWTPSSELMALTGTPTDWPDGVDTINIIGPVRTNSSGKKTAGGLISLA